LALFWRIWAAVTVVNLGVLTIFVGLATLHFGSINSGLVGGRLAVLAGRTVAPFEAAAGIGLPLSSVRNANALLERSRQTDEAILAIHVYDADGRIVHSTATPAPRSIPEQAIAARSAARGAPWHLEIDDGFLSSVNIAAPDGTSAGGILIVYPGGGAFTRTRAMVAELAMPAFAALIVSATLGAIVLRLGLRRPIDAFEEIDEAVADFERNAWRRAAGRDAPSDCGAASDLGALLEAAEARYREMGRAIARGGDGR